MIAPLWGNIIPALSGQTYLRVAQDSQTLERVSQMITDENKELAGYSPSVAVIASWFSMKFHDYPYPADESARGPRASKDGEDYPVLS
jgi:hypothetical protein